MKNQKGITLIALVITIIILLILAGVTIITLTGENGILNQASKARIESIKGKEIEQIKLSYNAVKIDKLKDSNSPVTSTDLGDELKKYNENTTAETDTENTELIIVTFEDTNNQYIVDENGNITFKGEKEEEKVEYIVGYGSDWLFDKTDNAIYRYTGDFSNLENNILVIPTYWKESESSTEEYEVKTVKNSGGNILAGNSNTIPNNLKLKLPFGLEKIDENAFYNCSSFVGDLVIPNSVNTINRAAFYNCSGFDGSLVIGDGVESVGQDAFGGCSGFSSDFVLGKNVSEYGYNCFGDLSSNFTGKLIVKSKKPFLSYSRLKNSAFSELVLENTVKEIKNEAFRGFSNLKGHLTIPNSVETIGEYAFYDCSSLTGDLIIPDNIKIINRATFYNCSGFDGSLIIGDGVESIGQDAFCRCRSFTKDFVLGKKVNDYGYNCFGDSSSNFTGKLIVKAEKAYLSYSGLKNSAFSELRLENTVKEIKNEAFRGFSNLKGNLTIPNSVESIGENAFYECSSLTGDLVIPDSIKTINRATFYKCSGFDGSLTIGNGVETIGTGAFEYCSGFTGNLLISENVTKIESNAFGNCNSITAIKVNNTENSISGAPWGWSKGIVEWLK